MAPANVVEALDALETITERLRAAGDERAVFPDVYAIITRRVKEAAVDGQGPKFLEPAWISRLAGIFCEYYLEALDASLGGRSTGSEAWNMAFHRGGAGGFAASLNALMGVNAHINYDLAQGLCQNIVGHGAANDVEMLRRCRHDHDLVNDILEAALPEILEALAGRYRCPLASLVLRSRGVREIACRAVLRVLRWWREQVWRDLLAMLSAADHEQRSVVLGRMSGRASAVARAAVALNRMMLPACLLLGGVLGGARPSAVQGRRERVALAAPPTDRRPTLERAAPADRRPTLEGAAFADRRPTLEGAAFADRRPTLIAAPRPTPDMLAMAA